MRILIVLNYFYPYVSGVSEYARSLAEALAGEHEVTILTGQHESDLPKQEVVDGYTIVRAPILFRLDKGYLSPALLKEFRRLQKQADVVNLHLPMLESSLLAALTSKPLALTYQCDMAYEGSLLSKLAVWGVRRSCAMALKQADQVATLSLDYAESSPFLRPHTAKTVEVWPPNRFGKRALNSVDSLPDAPGSVAPDEIRIGFVGRFVKEKGIDVLIDSMAHLSDLPVKLMLVGDFAGVAGGSIYDDVKSKIDRLGDRVELLGKLDDNALEAFYGDIDILALPSVNRFEAFGMVQVEAMGFGAIPVASDMPGVRATVRTTGIGFLAAPGDAEGLANAFRKAFEQRKTLSRKAVAERALDMQARSFADAYVTVFKAAQNSADA